MLDTEQPSHDVVMKNTHNNLLCDSNAPHNVHMIGPETCIFGHEEADINIINYMLMLINLG